MQVNYKGYTIVLSDDIVDSNGNPAIAQILNTILTHSHFGIDHVKSMIDMTVGERNENNPDSDSPSSREADTNSNAGDQHIDTDTGDQHIDPDIHLDLDSREIRVHAFSNPSSKRDPSA